MSKIEDTFFCSLLGGQSAIWYGHGNPKIKSQNISEIFGDRSSCTEFDRYICNFKKANGSLLSRYFIKKRLLYQTNEVIWKSHVGNGYCPLNFTNGATQFLPLKIRLNSSLAFVVDNENFESPHATTSLAILDGKTISFHVEHCGGSMFMETCEDAGQPSKLESFKKNVRSFYRDIKYGRIEYSNIISDWERLPKHEQVELEKLNYKSIFPETLKGISKRVLWLFFDNLANKEKYDLTEFFSEIGHDKLEFRDLKSHAEQGLKKIGEKLA